MQVSKVAVRRNFTPDEKRAPRTEVLFFDTRRRKLRDITALERQMQRHLEEPRTANRARNDAPTSSVRRVGRRVIAGHRIEARIEFEIGV